MKKNIYAGASIVLSIAFIASPLFASAQSVDASSSVGTEVQSLLSQITALEQQLKSLIGSTMSSSSMMTSPPPMGTSTAMRGGMGAMRCLPIMRNLSQGASGDDVTSLQQTLVDDGFLSASSTTGFFGPLTARAVMQMQVRFGIASSSTGFVGPLTRGFLRGGCGEGQGGAMGSSTSPAWLAGSSTHPMLNPFDGGSGDINQMMDGTSSGVHVMRPMMPVMGSSTMPLPPCMPNGAGASTTDDSGLGNSAAVAAAFFVPHVLIPGAMRPCSDVSGEMQQQ